MTDKTLRRLEERCETALEAARAHPYRAPVGTLWYAQDVPALLRVVRAAQTYANWHMPIAQGGTVPTEECPDDVAALAQLRAALRALEEVE